jgi:polyisoprenoid-binding protein YceI
MKHLFVYLSVAASILVMTTAFRSDPVITIPGKPASNTAVGKWQIDPSHSNVKFTVTHMVVSEVEGAFRKFDGTIEHSKPDFSDASVKFTVDVNSIDTDNEKRDGHLKSDDFFNAEKFPQMSFVSTSFTPVSGKQYKMAGNLTIREVTKPVTFDVIYNGSVTNGGKSKAGFKATTKINRFDYNLKWDRATEAGSLVVDKEVTVSINAEFDKVN